MEILKDIDLCCGCHACFNICPVEAIEMRYDSKGFLYPCINNERCIDCHQCKTVCPILHKPLDFKLEEIYGAYVKDEEERMSSCSGGIFAVLAKQVLKSHGVVFGAAYDDENLVYHTWIDTLDDLYKLKGTKYVQSRIEDSFKRAKKFLEENRIVLFSGTPCQIAGLKNFLRRDYDKLICLDLICHGVPSPIVWKKYLKEIAPNNKIEKVIFRSKSEGVSNSTIRYFLDDDKFIEEKYNTSPYIKGFTQNLYVRTSCTKCKFKGINRCSDITIGDFWSAKEFHPEFADDYGISTMIIHTSKGQYWLKKIEKEINIVISTKKEAECWNDCLMKPAAANPKTDLFYKDWKEKSLRDIIEVLKAEPEMKKTSIFVKISRLLKDKISSGE